MFSYNILYNKCVYMSTIVLYFVRFELLCTVTQKKNTETHLCLRIFLFRQLHHKERKDGFSPRGLFGIFRERRAFQDTEAL